MNLLRAAQITTELLKYRLTWNKRRHKNIYPAPLNEKFIGAEAAMAMIKDNSVCIVCAISGNQRIPDLIWALRERFDRTQHPSQIKLIAAAGQGGRGKAPGTLEEWGTEGMLSELISAHFETYNSILALADQGKVNLHCIPQGMLALLVAAQAEGKASIESTMGIGTFLTAENNVSSLVSRKGSHSYIKTASVDENGEATALHYQIPNIDVAIFNAPAADSEGNIYIDGCTTICESKHAALAAKRNGGIVIVTVGRIIPKREAEIYLHAELVDAIVYSPYTHQTAAFTHLAPLHCLTTSSEQSVSQGLAEVNYINLLAGITPRRNAIEKSVAARAAELLIENVPKGAHVNIGTGLPEEVCQSLYDQNTLQHITPFTEAGAIGGMPAKGIFFGANINPDEIISSPEIFKSVYEHLEATVVGFAQVDSSGNVNASRRGSGAKNFIGPGGFIDLTTKANTVIFVGSFMARAKLSFKKKTGNVKILKKGKRKFVAKVDEITFNGQRAIASGKNIFYVTDVGIFKLTNDGMKLIETRPGIDVQMDIRDNCSMEFFVSKDS